MSILKHDYDYKWLTTYTQYTTLFKLVARAFVWAPPRIADDLAVSTHTSLLPQQLVGSIALPVVTNTRRVAFTACRTFVTDSAGEMAIIISEVGPREYPGGLVLGAGCWGAVAHGL